MMDNDKEKNDKNDNTTQTTDKINEVANIENKPKPDCVNLEDELKGEFKVDCTPLQKLLGIEKMEYVSAGVCAFFHALSDTIAVSLESQIIEMIDEILYKKGQDDTSNLIKQNGGTINQACNIDNANFDEDLQKLKNCKGNEECTKLYREYARKYHPDNNEGCVQEATEYMNQINNNKKHDSSSSTPQDPNKTETFTKFETAIRNMKFNFDTEDSALFMDSKQNMQNELEQRIITEINNQLKQQKSKANNPFFSNGGRRRYSKKIKLRYGNKKNKTQKGGESQGAEERGYELPLKIPKHFWEKLISDLRVYLAQAINELISCEALKKHLVSGIYTCADNNFHNKIQYEEYKKILNEKIKNTVKNTNESLSTIELKNDFEFKKKLAQRLILSKQDKK